MKVKDFDYNLPIELIAQKPIEPRDHSKLLRLNKKTGEISDNHFYDIVDFLTPNDVLVINKTRVIQARLKGFKIGSGRDVEIFLHKQLSDKSWECLVFPGKKLKENSEVGFKSSDLKAKIISKTEEGRIIEFNKGGIDFLSEIEKIGDTPLPPYIKEKIKNKERYQTVFNEIEGSAAAPTAGLHFTPELLKKIQDKGVKVEKVLLHVGLGTFFPLLVDDIKEHKMHSEFISIEQEVSNRLNKYKSEGKRIIAVGTTSVRTLESFSSDSGNIGFGEKDTDIFIYPGYKWKFVDSLITNFHLPQSTLLMLVSSLAGKQNILDAYSHAVKNKYRFFSFGDAMFIE